MEDTRTPTPANLNGHRRSSMHRQYSPHTAPATLCRTGTRRRGYGRAPLGGRPVTRAEGGGVPRGGPEGVGRGDAAVVVPHAGPRPPVARER